MNDDDSLDELSKRRWARNLDRDLDTLRGASRQVGDAIIDTVTNAPNTGLDGINGLLIQAGLPENATNLIGVPLSLLTQAAAHLHNCGVNDDAIKNLFASGVPFGGCTCDVPECIRSPKRIQQTLRLIAYAIDELGILIHGEPEEGWDDDKLKGYVEKPTLVGAAMLGVIVDAGMHTAFAF